MKINLLILSILVLSLTNQFSTAQQLINPDFETWTNDFLVPSAMNPNSGNNTFGWWDYNYFNSAIAGSSPISLTRLTVPVHSGNYSVKLQTVVYTPTSWNIYKTWGYPFIGHEYNDTLGIMFNGKVNVSNSSFVPGIACSQKLTQFKFYYQYQPSGNDTAECRVLLLSAGTPVAGGRFKTGDATSGWQQATIDFLYVNGLTPDTLYILFSSSSLDYAPQAGSIFLIDDASYVYPTGVEQVFLKENGLTISPNPSNGIFTVQTPSNNSKFKTIEVYNLLGDKIYSTTSNKIDISTSPKGVYFVKVNDVDRNYTKKIVVQ